VTRLIASRSEDLNTTIRAWFWNYVSVSSNCLVWVDRVAIAVVVAVVLYLSEGYSMSSTVEAVTDHSKLAMVMRVECNCG
jgi:hypothetical protein